MLFRSAEGHRIKRGRDYSKGKKGSRKERYSEWMSKPVKYGDSEISTNT